MLILATDMARHAEIMDSFKDKLAANFDFSNKEHMDTVSIELRDGLVGWLAGWLVGWFVR